MHKVLLKENGWYVKLQIWTFGDVPYKHNFCPFFWLTIVCLLLFPFIGMYRLGKILLSLFVSLVMIVIVKPLESLADIIDKYICRPLYEHQVTTYVTKMDDNDAYNLYGFIFRWNSITHIKTNDTGKSNHYYMNEEERYDFICMSDRKRKIFIDRWYNWKRDNKDWKEKLAKVRMRRIEEENKLREERARLAVEKEKAKYKAENKAKRMKKLYLSLVKYTRYLLLLVVGIVTIYLVYWLALLGLNIYENWNAICGSIWSVLSAIGSFIVRVAPLTGIILLISFGITFATILFIKLIRKCSVSFYQMLGIKYIITPFRFVGKYPVRAVGKALSVLSKIKSVVNFFRIYFRTFKENNCPPIEWKQ